MTSPRSPRLPSSVEHTSGTPRRSKISVQCRSAPHRAPQEMRLVTDVLEELAGRPEGFVKDGRLQRLGGPTALCLPGLERQPMTFDHPVAKGAKLVVG